MWCSEPQVGRLHKEENETQNHQYRTLCWKNGLISLKNKLLCRSRFSILPVAQPGHANLHCVWKLGKDSVKSSFTPYCFLVLCWAALSLLLSSCLYMSLMLISILSSSCQNLEVSVGKYEHHSPQRSILGLTGWKSRHAPVNLTHWPLRHQLMDDCFCQCLIFTNRQLWCSGFIPLTCWHLHVWTNSLLTAMRTGTALPGNHGEWSLW